MIETLKVAAVLDLKGNFLQQYKALSDSFSKLEKQLKNSERLIERFSSKLNDISVRDPFSKMNVSLEQMRANLSAVVTQMGQLRSLSGFRGSSLRMGGTSDAAYNLRTDLMTDQFLYRKERDSLRDKSSASMGRHRIMHGHLRESLGFAGLRIGGGLSMPAMALAGAAYIGYKGESEWERALMGIQMQGFSGSQVQGAVDFANNANIYGMSPTSLLKSVRDAGMATKSMPMALKLAPALATIEYENSIMFHKKYSSAQAQSLVKFAEMRSGGDLNKMLDTINLVQKMMNVSGHNLMPLQMFTNITAGSLAMQHISDRGMFALEPIMQELNRAGLGTALQSGAFELLGGHINKNAAASLVHEGLGHMVGKLFVLNKDWANLYMTQPVQFAFNYHDLLKNKFHMTDKEISAQEEIDFVRTTSKFVGLANKNRAKIDRTLGLYDTVPGVQRTAQNIQGTEVAQMKNLSEAFSSMSKAWGKLIQPAELLGLKTLTIALNELANIFKFFNTPEGASVTKGFIKGELSMVTGGLSNVASEVMDLVHTGNSSGGNMSVQAYLDPHDMQHAVASAMGRASGAPLSGTSNVNSFSGRLLSQLNGGF